MTFLDVPTVPGRAGWLAEVLALAELHGWRADILGQGFHADLLILRRPRLVWVFVEPARGRLSKARMAHLLELRACGQEAYVWRPEQILRVERTLE